VYLGVTALSTGTAFSLVATVDGGAPLPTRLVEGRTTRGAALAGQYTYYYAVLNASADATVTVTVAELAGTAAVYMNANATLPSRGLYALAARTVQGTKAITLPPGSPLRTPAGLLTIAVFGASDTRYYITVSTSATVATLADGVPMEGSLALRATAYYSLPVPPGAGDVTFSTATLAGRTQLYIAK